jgi:hypothetical protein
MADKNYVGQEAWALTEEGSGRVHENKDEPPFLCVFASKAKAQGARLKGEKIIRVFIQSL